MSTLSLRELQKRPYRIPILADFIWSGRELLTVDNKLFLVQSCKIQDKTYNSSKIEDSLEFQSHTTSLDKPREVVYLTGTFQGETEIKTITTSKLSKTKDFGGEGKGSRLVKESMYLEMLNTTIINLQIPIDIEYNGMVYTNIIGAQKVKVSSAKADYALINTNDEEVFWISHKDKEGFQQWSGVTDFKDHPEVSRFIMDVRNNGEILPKTNYGRLISDDNLKCKAIFGKDYGQNMGINNVHMIALGEVKFTNIINNKYTIEAEKHWSNGPDPLVQFGDYYPILLCTYRSERNDLGVKNCRFSMYPNALRHWKDPLVQ